MSLITKNRKKVLFEYTSSFVNDEKGNQKYIIAIGRNITERKKEEEAREGRGREKQEIREEKANGG